MRFMTIGWNVSVTAGVLFGLHACGGQVNPATTGAPSEHRPVAVACGVTPWEGAGDAGAMTCHVSTDCTSGVCLHGVCGLDACLTDDDCAAGTLCLCNALRGGGLRPQGNVCVPAHCRLDSDCGAGEYCMPSRGYCGGANDFECTTPKDTCRNAKTDCSLGSTCGYEPTVGRFQCISAICSG
jgi:hypothetical protein